jgi:hypothetical protein
MKNSATGKPPLIIDPETYEAILKDPLYSRRAQIGVEIGRVIVKETPEKAVKDIPANLLEGSNLPDRPKKRASARSGKREPRDTPEVPDVCRDIHCENCGTTSRPGAKFCYACGTRLRDSAGFMGVITVETIIDLMHVDPLAGIVWCHWICERQAELASSPLLQRFLEPKKAVMRE